MAFRIESVHLGSIAVLVCDVFPDARGYFMETYRADRFRELGLPEIFVQENHSRSRKGVIRGLHYQWDEPMGKLMRVVAGSAFLVAVDIRKDSATLGQWFGIEASAENRKQVWAPAGFARGLCATSDYAEIQYRCTSLYNPRGESEIRFDDPALGIEWPVAGPYCLSEKDRNAQSLAEWLARPESENFRT